MQFLNKPALLKTDCIDCSFEMFCTHQNAENEKNTFKQHQLKRKEIFHRPQDTFKSLYLINYGALKTYEIDAMGNELIHGLYLANEVYGYEAIYQGNYFFASMALSDTLICEIPYANFFELIKTKPELLHRILYLMSKQLTKDSYLKGITAQQKIAAFIIDLQSRLTSGEKPPFVLPMTYQDIGHYLTIATETVSRILSRFQKNQLLHIENKCIQILQQEKLLDIAKNMT